MTPNGGKILNRGNLVNRIGQARRHRNFAICIAVIATMIAWAGWIRSVTINLPSLNSITNSDCEEYARTMCNNGKE